MTDLTSLTSRFFPALQKYVIIKQSLKACHKLKYIIFSPDIRVIRYKYYIFLSKTFDFSQGGGGGGGGGGGPRYVTVTIIIRFRIQIYKSHWTSF